MKQSFTVVRGTPEGLSALGVLPLVSVEATGSTVADIARALEMTARRMRVEHRRAEREASRPGRVIPLRRAGGR